MNKREEPFDWQTASASELELQFNPRAAVPDFESYLGAWADLGKRARAEHVFEANIRYGKGAHQLIDIFPGAESGPAVVYVHGGFWRALSKDAFSGVAGTLSRFGITTAIVGYDLCPEVTLDRQIDEIGEALDWCFEHLASYNVDTSRLFLAGSSAGAHLLATNLFRSVERSKRYAGACLSSGIYDVRPVMRISVNRDIGLDEASAERNSPLLQISKISTRLAIVVGGAESPAWISQSRELKRICDSAGCDSRLIVVPNAHHFSVGLGRPGSEATNAMLDLMGFHA